MRPLLLAFCILVFGAGCAGQAEEAPESRPISAPPETVPVSSAVPIAEDTELPTLARDSPARLAKRLTIRVRNVGCAGVATGSGFAVARDILVTNRHVLAGASDLEVSTWDGQTLKISAAAVGRLGDLGIARVEAPLPQVGQFGPPPKADTLVTAVGYPLGGPLRLSRGFVIDRVDGGEFGIPGAVVRLTARVEHGNSGGPLLDSKGRVAGVVYAIERSTGYGLAIPVDTMRRLVSVGGYEAVTPCGSE
jgi:S1-C subfamily serine protease